MMLSLTRRTHNMQKRSTTAVRTWVGGAQSNLHENDKHASSLREFLENADLGSDENIKGQVLVGILIW